MQHIQIKINFMEEKERAICMESRGGEKFLSGAVVNKKFSTTGLDLGNV